MESKDSDERRMWPFYVFVGCLVMGYLGDYYMSVNDLSDKTENKIFWSNVEKISLENPCSEAGDSSFVDSSFYRR